MSSNQKLTEEQTDADSSSLRSAAACLQRYLVAHRKNNQLYDVLQHLADETLDRLEEGKDPRFNYRSLQLAVSGEAEQDPSAWFSRHWKTLRAFKSKYGPGLNQFAANHGFSHYPDIIKHESDGGAGNQALIALIACPVDIAKGVPARTLDIHHQDIAYIPAETIAIAGWAKLLFDREYTAEGWRKWLLIWPTLLWIFALGLITTGSLLLLVLSPRPLTTIDLALIIFAGLAVWCCKREIEHVTRWADDQIVMTPESMLGFRERSVCLELYRPQADAPKRARMAKYVAQCPTCGGQILLDYGEPDFPRRIVGRCENSPREHVFSFDKATLSGYRLR